MRSARGDDDRARDLPPPPLQRRSRLGAVVCQPNAAKVWFGMRRNPGLPAAAFAFLFVLLGAADLAAQVPNEVQEAIRSSLTDSREARLIVISPVVGSFTLYEPRLEMGRVVGRVSNGQLGQAESFAERSFPLDGVRELRVKRARWVEGLAYGGFLGLAVAGALHVRCQAIETCDGALGLKFGVLYPLSAAVLGGSMGGLAYMNPTWKTVYTRRPGSVFQTDSGYDPVGRWPTAANISTIPLPNPSTAPGRGGL
jgi:hypothetical protein